MQLRSIRIGFLVLVAAGTVAPSQSVLAQGCPGSGMQSNGPDVIVGRLAQDQGFGPEITNFNTASGVDGFSVGTTSCNLGNQQLLWEQSNDPDHPVIGQNCFRLKTVNGSVRFEHVGQSWLKHGFTALQQQACCTTCQSSGTGSRLGLGCSDPYQAGRNAGQSNAGPKWQVNATTGVNTQPKANPQWSGTVMRRMQIPTGAGGELEVSNFVSSSTKYFVEGQYIAADDAASGNKNNNASYRPITVSGGQTEFSFGVFGNHDTETRRQMPGIQAWREFGGVGVVLNSIVTPEDGGRVALVILGSQVTDLGNGVHHYEYAIQNLNSDRSIASFSIPVSGYANVINIGFHDVNYHSGEKEGLLSGPVTGNRDGTDWQGVFDPMAGTVSWTCPQTYAQNVDANAIRWGTLYNFRFDCDLTPANPPGNATLVQFKPGAQTITAATQMPSSVGCLAGDMNADGLIDALDIARFSQIVVDGGATPREKCAGDRGAVPNFIVNLDDVDGFTTCVLNAGC